MFLIVDLEKQVSYTINDRQKFVMVAHGRPELGKVGMMIPGGVDPCAPAPGSDQKQFTCRQVGEETVNGRHALKLQITETKNGRTVTRMAWFDPKLRAILKIDIGDSTIMKLQNIQEAPQPARLFVVPDDYRRMDGGSGPIPIPQH